MTPSKLKTTITLTSGKLQCSKVAFENSLAAFLYFLFCISASPAAQSRRQAVSWALVMADWGLDVYRDEDK